MIFYGCLQNQNHMTALWSVNGYAEWFSFFFLGHASDQLSAKGTQELLERAWQLCIVGSNSRKQPPSFSVLGDVWLGHWYYGDLRTLAILCIDWIFIEWTVSLESCSTEVFNLELINSHTLYKEIQLTNSWLCSHLWFSRHQSMALLRGSSCDSSTARLLAVGHQCPGRCPHVWYIWKHLQDIWQTSAGAVGPTLILTLYSDLWTCHQWSVLLLA